MVQTDSIFSSVFEYECSILKMKLVQDNDYSVSTVDIDGQVL